MDKDQLDDLKEYMARILDQQTYDLREEVAELRKDTENGFNRLDQKIDDLSDSVAQALDTSNDETAKQLKNHESRITKLENASA
jgi:F0F1-type ATP synthase membrane subunit b/b'